MIFNKLQVKYIALSVVCLLVAIYGLGFGARSTYTARNHGFAFEKIAQDSWLESGSKIKLSGLAANFNRAELLFGSSRPGGSSAVIDVSICSGEFNYQLLTAPKVNVPLRGSCEPRTLSITSEQFFQSANSGDKRHLIEKLNGVRVSSPLGVPILAPSEILLSAICLFLLVVAFLKFFPLSGYALLFIELLLGFYSLSNTSSENLPNLFYVWLLVFGISLGYGSSRGESQTQNADNSRAGLSLLLLILVVGTGVRFWGLNFGLPANYHPDEVPKINAVMRMVQYGDLNPRYFLHPSLLLYSTYAVNKIIHPFFTDSTFRETAFLAGRIVSALAGSLSILLIFHIAKLLYDYRAGLLSAAFLAVFPLHVTCSRYLKEDAYLLFWILMSLLFVLISLRRNRPALLLVASVFAGLSFSTKYSGMLTCGFIAIAPWLKSESMIPDKRFFKWAVCGAPIFFLSFLAATPYALLDSATFIKDFNSESHHMQRGHTVAIDAWSQMWMYHLRRSISPGMSLLITLIALVGVGAALRRRKIEDLLLVGLVLLFYLPSEWVKAKPAPQPERYILPCLPFLAVLASRFLLEFRTRLRPILFTAVVFLCLLIPAQRTANLASELKDDTRTQMASWMADNLPHGSKVYLDWKPYSPRFFKNEFQIEHIMRARIIDLLSVNALRDSGHDYLVLSSLFYGRYFSDPKNNPAIRQHFRQVFSKVPIIKQIEPKYGSYGFHNPVLTLFSLKKEDFERLDRELKLKAEGKILETSNEKLASIRW